jgi:2-iminobutanoate/2-iminopropanoate deaminase
VLDPSGQHVTLHRPELMRDAVYDQRLHSPKHDPELLVRVAVQWNLGAGIELDQVEHRTRAEERAAGHAGGQLERADVVEANKLRLRLHAAPDYPRRVPDREEIRVATLPEPLSHYTDAVRVGELLFLSGVVPVDGEGKLIGEGDVVEQARQVFRTIREVLAAAGATFADVAKVTVFLTDVDDRAKINPVRQEVFGAARPASTLVEISRLAVPGALIEVECMAALPSR